jgi:tRNA(adenine34) deaminase
MCFLQLRSMGPSTPSPAGVVSLFQVGQDARLNHLLDVEGGLLAEESATLLNNFFRERRGGAR